MFRLIRIPLGILFLMIGVIGGFIPVLQGWVFICLGAICLSPELPFLRKYIYKIRAKFPKSRSLIRKWMLWIKKHR